MEKELRSESNTLLHIGKYYMSNIKFNPMPQHRLRPRFYLSLKTESINNFYALNTALRELLRYNLPYDIGVAVSDSRYLPLASAISCVSLPAVSVAKATHDGITVAQIGPEPSKISFWIEKDKENDFEVQKKKYPHIDPSRLKPGDFTYTEPTAIMRDIFEIFGVTPGGRPLHILELSRTVSYISSNRMKREASRILLKNGIKSGPFTLVENNFANKPSDEPFPAEWGRVVVLPPPSEILEDERDLLGYLALLGHKDCVAVGLTSTDYIMAGSAAHQLNNFIIWDIRPSTARVEDDLSLRSLGWYHIPTNIFVISPNSDDTLFRTQQELVYILGEYYKSNRSLVGRGLNRVPIFRPKMPSDYAFAWGE